MKKQYLLFLIVLAASFLLFSCDIKGGTVNVYNSTSFPSWTVCLKGDANVLNSFASSFKEGEGKGVWIQPGQSYTFNIDENGIYFVAAMPPVPCFTELVGLVSLGSKHDVKIK